MHVPDSTPGASASGLSGWRGDGDGGVIGCGSGGGGGGGSGAVVVVRVLVALPRLLGVCVVIVALVGRAPKQAESARPA
jgi:hypothetical protein